MRSCTIGTVPRPERPAVASDGVVARSYVANLRKGRIENPSYEKMLAIAGAMGFPPGDVVSVAPAEGRDLAGRVGHLFGAIRHPGTGEPYTDAEVARMSVAYSRRKRSRESGQA
jgi:transcriptional regulator with XRE-family HTH domain